MLYKTSDEKSCGGRWCDVADNSGQMSPAKRPGRGIFKAGAGWLIVMGLVHSISLFEKQTAANDTERQLLDLMSNYRFNLLGSMCTMSGLLTGFSAAFSLSTIGLGAVNLAVSGASSGILKRAALVNAIFLAAMIANAVHFFFIVPIAFLSVACLLFVIAWIKLESL